LLIVNEPVCGSALACPLQEEEEEVKADIQLVVDSALPSGEIMRKGKLVRDHGATEMLCVDFKVFID
jgi:hypothetical protein